MDVDSNPKRHVETIGENSGDEENVDTPKRTKINATVKGKAKITSLNNDCLVEIFNHLELTDLISVISASNKHFFDSIYSVFRRKYCKDGLNISNSLESSQDSNQSTYEAGSNNQTEVQLHNMIWYPQAVEVMRHFGHTILTMKVNYNSQYRRLDHYIEDAIIKYCRKSLTEISFINADYFTLEQINKPFPNVLKVTFIGGKLCKLISDFNQWFPLAEHLDLIGPTILKGEDKKILAQHFPKIRHLGVKNISQVLDEDIELNSQTFMFQNDDLLETFDLNPQLKSLTIENGDVLQTSLIENDGIDLGPAFLASINKKLPELTDLDLTMYNYHFVPYSSQHELNFKALKTLRFEFENSLILSKIPILSHDIECIDLVSQYFEFDQQLGRDCSTFVQQNGNVKNLIIRGPWQSSGIFIDTMTSFATLPRLSALIIETPDIEIKHETINNLLSNCKSLTKIQIYVDVSDKEEFVDRYINDFKQIAAFVGVGWNRWNSEVTYDQEYFDISLKISRSVTNDQSKVYSTFKALSATRRIHNY